MIIYYYNHYYNENKLNNKNNITNQESEYNRIEMWLNEMEYFNGLYGINRNNIIYQFSFDLLTFEEKLHEVYTIL